MNSFSNENSNDNHDYVFKFVIIGDSGVGKSCIMHHFIFNKCKRGFNYYSQERNYTDYRC